MDHEQPVPIFQQLAGGQKIVTDGLCSYSAAMKEIGNADRQEVRLMRILRAIVEATTAVRDLSAPVWTPSSATEARRKRVI
jgi:hypothetical protein